MKYISMLMMAFILGLGINLTFSEKAHAGALIALSDRGLHVGYDHNHQRRNFRNHHGHHHRHRDKHHNFRRHDNGRYNDAFKHRSNRYADKYRRRFTHYQNKTAWSRKPCHQVYKRVFDDYGHPRKFGGTMCYNDYGEGYLVRGSRYRIR